MRVQLINCSAFAATVALLTASCASESKGRGGGAAEHGLKAAGSDGGRIAQVEGARPGVFDARTGAWAGAGPPCTDNRRSFGMVVEDCASALLHGLATIGAGLPPGGTAVPHARKRK